MTSIEDVIGYSFKNKELLKEALTHKSHSTERKLSGHNERLEFLGDSVLGMAVSYYLFVENPDKDEGYLSKIKSFLVSQSNLSKWAREMNLGEHIFLGVGETKTGGQKRNSILSDSLEALIGAIYLDGGFEKAWEFVVKRLAHQPPEILKNDYKSNLQEMIQKRHKKPPDYEIMSAEGPEHDKIFTVRVRIDGKILGIGSGKNKKEAQQSAARNAIHYLDSHHY